MVLRELRVRDLGVIDDLTLVLEPGMTALTGETGAGKTLLVEAIDLLLGGRADPVLVRPGAKEAVVEGRFWPSAATRPPGTAGDEHDDEGDDVVLARVVPASGRSRAYVGGRMAALSGLAEAGGALVDLHGQHAHQALFSPAAQRAALDRAGGVDHGPLQAARRALAAIESELAALGGDERSRAREIDLLRFQLDELDAASLEDPHEEDALVAEEDRLSGAGAHREAAGTVHDALQGDEGALDRVGAALAAVAGRAPLQGLHDRLRAVEAELADLATEARGAAERFEDDPERLAAVSARRQQLRALRRKYGDTLAEVIAFRDSTRARLQELEGWDARAAALDAQRAAAADRVAAAAAALGAARRAAAPALAAAVEAELRTLAMPRARFEVVVGDAPAGDDVTWLLGANAGEAALPLAKIASGGELARTMLALRLVVSDLRPSSELDTAAAPTTAGDRPAPARTLVFDEVDAGIGGEAAVAVGRALAALARHHQVLVVTHLPQVAAFADHQIAVSKQESGGRTRTSADILDESGRVVELSRMLSGSPDSATARSHATELLAQARGGPG
ncbi:DNA repair protein RecN [Acidiferrimicrobium sp. IK]|uniref:DNA repair protein RecN n=1 Tax=Acidiferrimicrobium sp. IK TaxID=2871700 RepID=UPI0021CB0E17|nr:DNA repair protein RecN [Acidiferrimicrobium sp. IK]MCU4184742.1 DNA repair protein RecN [Acidiferrimicrobium sp. IK]